MISLSHNQMRERERKNANFNAVALSVRGEMGLPWLFLPSGSQNTSHLLGKRGFSSLCWPAVPSRAHSGPVRPSLACESGEGMSRSSTTPSAGYSRSRTEKLRHLHRNGSYFTLRKAYPRLRSLLCGWKPILAFVALYLFFRGPLLLLGG